MDHTPNITNLLCSRCDRTYAPQQLLQRCDCGGPLLAQYDLSAIRRDWSKTELRNQPYTMWRYAKILPVSDPQTIVSLQEGWTPLHRLTRLGYKLKTTNLWLKDEGRNPTASFKARGLSCAVSMAKALGARKLAIPSAGNAASALAAYAAAAGLEAHIFMPSDVPQANFLECKVSGAHVTLVNGLIDDCGVIVAERSKQEGWFDVSTLKEPYRIEGKKTMGYEAAEQFDWTLPDAIIYPCGGGVGLIGMWKAFDELEQLGWIGPKRPRMIAVQAAGCDPITKAFEKETRYSELHGSAHTVASGLRVPKPLGDFLILDILARSGGVAISITDEEMLDGGIELARSEGIFPAPEGGACIAAIRKLLRTGFLKPSDQTLVYSTGSGLKYLEAYATRYPRYASSEQDKLGGLITPR